MKNIAYYNGRITSIEEAFVPVGDRALYFGDGVYDVATMRKGKYFALSDHLDRFFRSAEMIRIELTVTKAELEKICLDLAARLDSDVEEAVLYLQASRGTAPRRHAFPDNVPSNLLITLKPTTFGKFGKEIKAITAEDERFLYCHIKTLNLLPNVLFQQKAKESGCYETIFHRGDRVTEGTHSSVCILKNGVFQAPPLDHFILPSITRAHYLALCREIGVPAVEKPFTMREMMDADEVLIFSSTALMNRCTEIDGKKVGGKDPTLCEKLAAAYKARILAETN